MRQTIDLAGLYHDALTSLADSRDGPTAPCR
jgi:hypothetical protein